MMSITYQGITHELPLHMLWPDEYQYSPVTTEQRFGTTGRQFLHMGVKQAGRTFTLDGVTARAWMPRPLIDVFQAWSEIPGAVFQLSLRGKTYDVVFDSTRPPAFEATAIWSVSDDEHNAEMRYFPSFKFLEK